LAQLETSRPGKLRRQIIRLKGELRQIAQTGENFCGPCPTSPHGHERQVADFVSPVTRHRTFALLERLLDDRQQIFGFVRND
jgi:hypothetical protein